MKKNSNLKKNEILQKNATFSENLFDLKKNCRIFFGIFCVALAILVAAAAQILCTQNLLRHNTQFFGQTISQPYTETSAQNIFPPCTGTGAQNILQPHGTTSAEQTPPQTENSSESSQAAAQSSVLIEDEVFGVALSGITRSYGSATFSQQTATDFLDQQHTYYVTNWKNLLRFSFAINGENTENRKMISYKLRVQYAKTDNLSGVVWTGETKTITSDTVKDAAQSYSTTFGFDVDGTDYVSNGANVHLGGYGYGLYHFTFSYCFSSNNQVLETSLQNGFYVAVLPDDAKNIQPKDDIRILHSTTYSQQLLNQFTLTLSDKGFDYIKDSLVEWDVVGTDAKGVHYCLSEYSRQKQPLYANYTPLYPTLSATTGKTFTFNSRGVQGSWTVTCTIKNNDGSVKLQLSKSNLTTSKVQQNTFNPTMPIIITLVVVLCGFAIVVIVLAIQLFKERKL